MSTVDLLTPDEREARAPKWLRGTLSALRAELRHARRLAEDARLRTEPDTSYAVVNRLLDPPIGLGVDPFITFTHEPGGPIIHGINVRLARTLEYQRGRLEVSTSGIPLTVRPSSSNRLYVNWGYDL